VPTVTIIPVGGTVTFFNGNGPTHLITGQPGVGLTRRRAPTQRHRFLYVRQGRHVPLRVRPPSRDVGAIVVGDAATALAVTDESGGVHATGAEVSTASTGADVSDGVVLAAGTALGALAGMAVTAAALLRRRTSVVKEPLGSN